jgi:hypothetical protein
MDVSDGGSDQELTILIPPNIVNKTKTVTTADLLPEKSKQLYRKRNVMICLWNGARRKDCKNI